MPRLPLVRPPRWHAPSVPWILGTVLVTATPTAPAGEFIRDVTDSSGLSFQHPYGESSMTSILEAAGSGHGFLDFDGGGNLDGYVVSGCYVELVEERANAASDLSQNDPRLHFGLGRRASMGEASIRWPSGRLETANEVPINQTRQVIEEKDTK